MKISRLNNSLLVATRNRGKIAELAQLLAQPDLVLHGLDEFPAVAEVEETGTTFAANAELKAREYAQATGLWALADDSGLEVSALHGAPGVYSARYGTPDLDDAGRVSYLLQQLTNVPAEHRQARFVCVMALAAPSGEIVFSDAGFCPGHVTTAPRGTGGFGYDPIFIPDGYTQTFGELPAAIKHNTSHRAQAVRLFHAWLSET